MASFKGHFDGSTVVLDEPASLAVGQVVRIIVDAPADAAAEVPLRTTLAGFSKGLFVARDDFNDPLDAFAEYR